MHQYTSARERQSGREEREKGGRGAPDHPSSILHHPPAPPASGRRAIPASHPPSIVISSLQYLLLLPATMGLAMTYDTCTESLFPLLASALGLISSL